MKLVSYYLVFLNFLITFIIAIACLSLVARSSEIPRIPYIIAKIASGTPWLIKRPRPKNRASRRLPRKRMGKTAIIEKKASFTL